MFVIKKGQYYVAKDDRAKAYTSKLKHAIMFPTREEAKKYTCRNERIVKLQMGWTDPE